MGGETDTAVEDYNLLKRGTMMLDTPRLVILLLLATEDYADIGIADHELYLLLARGGVERHCTCTYAPRAKV